MKLFLTIFTGIALFIIGATTFSFINIFADRYAEKLPLMKGAITCPNCGREKKFYEMIPILSFLFFWGECKHCGVKLSRRGFCNELIGGLIAELLFFRFGETMSLATPCRFSTVLDISLDFSFYKLLGLLTVFAMFAMLDLVLLVDARTMEIPNIFNYIIFGISVFSMLTMPGIGWLSHLIGFVCTSLPLFLITLAIPGAFGGGDIRLLAATGLMLGWKLAVLALFIGIVTGGLYGLFMLVTKKLKRGDHFPFGPYLCFGVGIAAVAGTDIINWYLSLAKPA
ncbi:MAG: prepilin peptidase [Lachnospiraceae bacterium]|nr:prepilin peptidase [Lachnospiraceae bacterium]